MVIACNPDSYKYLCELCEIFATLRETYFIKDGSRKVRQTTAKLAKEFKPCPALSIANRCNLNCRGLLKIASTLTNGSDFKRTQKNRLVE
jgi:hypothetical protein